MKAKWIITAASAMAVASVAPQFVHADPYRHPVVRYDRFDRHRDFDEDISIREVPGDVMRTVDRERHGRRIEAVQYVHRDDKFFYRFRIDDPHPRDRDMSIRVAPDGRLLSVEEAERYDPRYHR